MVGSSIAREAKARKFEIYGSPHEELDFTDRNKVFRELSDIKPDVLVIAAAVVGGIYANLTRPVDFLSRNLQIQTNLLDAAHSAGIERVVFLGSSCAYPGSIRVPISEDMIMSGALESTNEAYAIAKIAGVRLVEAYREQYKYNWISLMPTNLYGPGDNFHPADAHVLPALVHKFHRAKSLQLNHVEVWGDGSPLREFLHVDDLSRAILDFVIYTNKPSILNIGSGHEITILGLAELISEVVGFTGEIKLNPSFPNGTPRKFLDSTQIFDLGWTPTIDLRLGIEKTYSWFIRNEWDVAN